LKDFVEKLAMVIRISNQAKNHRYTSNAIGVARGFQGP